MVESGREALRVRCDGRVRLERARRLHVHKDFSVLLTWARRKLLAGNIASIMATHLHQLLGIKGHGRA